MFCALLDNNQVKCWGKVGDHSVAVGGTSWGAGPNEMGDNLTTINWGPGKSVVNMCVGELLWWGSSSCTFVM